MNRIKYLGLLTIVLGSIILAGCSAKVYNVESKKITQKVDTLKVKDVILNAGLSLGWSMNEVDNNTITASILLRGHSAIVIINYTDTSYSINLKKANNLNYNKEDNSIHKNYNGWIKNLEHTIDGFLEPLVMNNALIEKAKQAQSDKKNKVLQDTGHQKKEYSEFNEIIIKDVEDKAISTTFKLTQITKEILNAGKSLGWIMEKQKEGFILARNIDRHHSAIVRIDYDTSKYSITYITSENLSYKKDVYGIHAYYNRWIKRLEDNIDVRLNNTSM